MHERVRNGEKARKRMRKDELDRTRKKGVRDKKETDRKKRC
jgi:hypothetical protein